MPLDPVARKLLDTFASAGLPPMHTLPAATAREMSRAGQANVPPGPDVAHVENRTVPGPAGEIPVRVYRPGDRPDLPVLVWYHGGGWVIGDLESIDATCRRLCLLAEAAVVSVDYRLAPEHPAPAAAEDAYAALQWVAAHAAELGGDPARVAVGGESAGGNLAAVVSLLARDRGGPAIAHQVLVYPVTDCAMDTASYAENREYLLTPELMTWFWDQYAPRGIDRAAPIISPLRAADLSGLPSAHVLTAEFDPLRDEGRAYADRLRAAGVPVRYENYDGQIHTFFTSAHVFDAGARAVAAVAEQLRTVFAAGETPGAGAAPAP